MTNTTTVVRTEFETASRRLAAAIGWADLFDSKGNTVAAAEECRLASFLADCICRSDFSRLTPDPDWKPRYYRAGDFA